MFKNRTLAVKVVKDEKEKEPEVTCCHRTFEEKTENVRDNLENLGRKVFLGICIYIVLDTYRQVSVAKASNPYH